MVKVLVYTALIARNSVQEFRSRNLTEISLEDLAHPIQGPTMTMTMTTLSLLALAHSAQYACRAGGVPHCEGSLGHWVLSSST
ncbi:hypothetical protein J6590_004010 [Homalodisca vitripennis]|nr:hypothetical protein J6590_004010 [Homalodisca vitripennis]